jgi:hypothetical protein
MRLDGLLGLVLGLLYLFPIVVANVVGIDILPRPKAGDFSCYADWSSR